MCMTVRKGDWHGQHIVLYYATHLQRTGFPPTPGCGSTSDTAESVASTSSAGVATGEVSGN